MSKYRKALPQCEGDFFITDGGIETTLIFHDGLALPFFAAFHLLRTAQGEKALRHYFSGYAALAARLQTGLILETATWRASADWGDRLGYDAAALADVNRRSVALLEDVRVTYETDRTRIVISGCVGPRGDGYVADTTMSEIEAETYHRQQIETFAATSTDLVTAITMNYCEEAVGIARAARRAGLPVVISFTVETDGRLPTGQTLREAIAHVDDATSGYPAYYMLNCAHPAHFDSVLEPGETWTSRIRGLRANASRRSHAELNEAPDLDIGDPAELGRDYAALRRQRLHRLNVMGGCCGTDERHVEQIATACRPLFGQLG